jgi:hypothetical protein
MGFKTKEKQTKSIPIMKLKMFIANSRVIYPKLIDALIQHK